MALQRASTIVGPGADALADTLESIAADELQVLGEYDAHSHELLYVENRVVEKHGGVGAVEAASEAFFDYYHIDFLERDLLEDMLWLGEVGTFVTFHDHGIVIQAPAGEAAVFIALDVTASVDDVQITIQNTLHDAER